MIRYKLWVLSLKFAAWLRPKKKPDFTKVDKRPRYPEGTRYIDSAGRHWTYCRRIK